MEVVECAIVHEPIGDMNLHLALETIGSGNEESNEDDESTAPLWN